MGLGGVEQGWLLQATGTVALPVCAVCVRTEECACALGGGLSCGWGRGCVVCVGWCVVMQFVWGCVVCGGFGVCDALVCVMLWSVWGCWLGAGRGCGVWVCATVVCGGQCVCVAV